MELKIGFKFVSKNQSKWTFIFHPTTYAISCKKCGHDCTQYHDTKKGALKEFSKRGHSKHMCEYFQRNPYG